MTARLGSGRRGISLVELLVAMTLLGFIGLAILRTFTSQARIADLHAKRVDARAVSRAPINVLMSASASAVTLRIPAAMGVVCGSTATTTILSLMPVDSVVLATAALSGHAYRNATGLYTYTEGTTSVSADGSNTCNTASITTPNGGRQVAVTPRMVGSAVGTIAFLYQRVRYEFAASSAIAGRVGLWRTLESSGAREELAAPFDAASRFRFYRVDQDTSDVVVPPVGEIRGLDLELIGASERARFGRSTPETSRLQTAVFFMNRLN
jgi:type II secretory pathway pseudopilin PulG